jgi:hypothetical protein
MLASEQFIKLARQLLKTKAHPEDLALLVPGNPAYASDRELESIVDAAIDELQRRFGVHYGGGKPAA